MSAALHVAPGGDDRAAGTATSPLRTPQAAVLAARLAGAARRVVLHPGLYPDTRLVLGPEDSGLVLEGAGPGEAVLCGGAPVVGWEPEGRGLFSAPAPAGVRAGEPLDALLVAGAFAPQARWPRRGALRHGNEFPVRWLSATAGGWERRPTREELMHLYCRADDLPADLPVASVRVQLFHQWDESRVGCAACDRTSGTITFSQAPGHPPGAFAEHGDPPKARTYVLWNLPAGLHEPGQWWHDCARNRIVYWPRPHEDPRALEVIAPVHQGVLSLLGRPGEPVRDVVVRDLAIIAGSGGTRPAGFGAGAVAGALHLLGVSGITLERLHIHHTAGAGIRRDDPAGGQAPLVEGVRVSRCHIHHAGGPGVRIEAASGCVVEDCTIEDVGLVHTSALALSLSGEGSVIRHNLVRRCPYSAIQSAGARGIVVEGNRVEEFMQRLDDGAAVYVFAGTGAVIRGNAVHGASGRLAHAYYLDERSEDCLVEGNLAVDTASPVLCHMARGGAHRGNVFLDRGAMTLAWPRSRGFAFRDNVLVAGGDIVLRAEEGAVALDGNVLHTRAGRVLLARLAPDGYDDLDCGPLAPDAANRRDDPGLTGTELERPRAAPPGFSLPDFSGAGPRREDGRGR